jgi:hypothetical protein
MNEKEKVYAERDALRRRVFNLRKDNAGLRKALSEPEIRRMRAEHDQMKKALSMIAYSPDAKYDDIEHVRVVAAAALTVGAATKRSRARTFAKIKRQLIAQQKAARRTGHAES